VISFLYISSLSVAVPVTAGAICYKSLPKAGKYVAWLLFTWLATELTGILVASLGHENWTVYMVLSLVELFLIPLFFREIWKSKQAKLVIQILSWIGVMIILWEYAYTGDSMGPISMIFSCSFYFGMCLYTFHEMIFKEASDQFKLLVISIMLMFMGSAGYFASWQLIKYEEDLFLTFAHVHGVLLIICYILFTVGIWRLQRS
jgi:hypothetical protein